MAIFLITGSPGGGKTLFAVKTIIEDLVPTGREIYTDIEGFDHAQFGTVPFGPPDDQPDAPAGRFWESVPDGAVLVLDEVQRAFPPRNPASTVPPYISAFETHRHRGIDVYLITQGPKLIDRHLWPLVERHFHLHRAFGMKRSTLRTWETVNEAPGPTATDSSARKGNFQFKRRYYGAYKSASSHLTKSSLPVGKFAMAIVPALLAVFLGFRVYSSFGGSRAHAETAPTDAVATALAAPTDLRGCYQVVGMLGDALIYEPSEGGVRFIEPWAASGDPVRAKVRC